MSETVLTGRHASGRAGGRVNGDLMRFAEKQLRPKTLIGYSSIADAKLNVIFSSSRVEFSILDK